MLYTIKNNYLEVQISDNGAEIKSIKYLGKDYLHNSDPKFWGRSAPLLWPNIGTIKNGTASINGINYPMKKHGFLRDTLCSLESIEDNKIIFKAESSIDTLKLYPYEFKMWQYKSEGKVNGISQNVPLIMSFTDYSKK